MTKTLRVLGFGPLVPSAAPKPAAVAGPGTAADGTSGAVAPPAPGRPAGKGRPLFFLRGLVLAEAFSISPYGLA